MIVTIEREESGWYFVTDNISDRYGGGATREEALEMWRECFISYLAWLDEHHDRLSPRLKRHRKEMHRELYFTWRYDDRTGDTHG